MSNPEAVSYDDLESTDVISIDLVPERKGLILKHCEYYVSSRRHGTTVTRRYNDFVQLYDVLYAKYPYRAVCRLPPKRVVVNGGSPVFLQRRRAALQRWLTLLARHPVLAHDADLRTFLCETSSRLERPKHDEFTLAGTQESGHVSVFLQRRRAALQRWLTLLARHPVLAHDADLRTFLCETSSRLERPKHDEFTLAGTQESGHVSVFLQRRRAALQRWLTLLARHPVLAHDADLRTFLCETSSRLERPKHDEFTLAGTQESGHVSVFLQRRRAALQRWLTLLARHPVLAHDADLRTFLCETSSRLERPKHDEFTLAGTQESGHSETSTEELQAAFATSHEQLRLVHLGLDRLFQIFERAEGRCEAERADIRELGAGLNALSATNVADTARWTTVREALKVAADLAVEMGESATEETDFTEDGIGGRLLLALDALSAYRELCTRLTRGLHAERAAAAASTKHSAAAQLLRSRHRYALAAAAQEAVVSRAYALSAVESLPPLFRTQGAAHARVATLWADLYSALRHAAKHK